MPKLHLNERAVARLVAPDPSGKDVLYWSLERKGFGVRCSGTTNVKMYIVQRDLPGGKPRRVNIGPCNGLSFKEADKRAADMLDDLRRGNDPKRKVNVPTLRSTLESYLGARKDLAPGSVRMYRQIETNLKAWMDLPLHEITSEMVEERHRALAATVRKTKNPRYTGAATANFAMRTLRILWNFAADRTETAKDLPLNPVRRLKRQWYAVPRRERLVTAEQLPAFYRAVMALENPIARDYILLMLFSGLRRREAATLQWEHIDLVERVIRLPAAATKAGRKLDLPMSDYIRDMLIARRALGNAGFVFPGRGASRHTIKPFRAIAKASGIAVSAHDLRRTFATIAENTEGISPYALKAMINHALGNNDVTGDYIFISTPVLREAVQKVCDRMKRLCGVASIDGQNVAKFG